MEPRSTRAAAALLAGVLAVPLSAPAAPTTYVATYGSDANPCSLTQPCRSFDAALVQTSTDGEIVVLDSGGYGTVAINKSVSIFAPDGVYAGISVFAGTGIAIAAPASRVVLSGLTVVGMGGDSGIAATASAPMHVAVERSTISGFQVTAIDLCCSAGEAVVRDTTLYANHSGISAIGWKLLAERTRSVGHPFGAAWTFTGTRSTFSDTTLALNGVYAVYVDTASGSVTAVRNSVIAENNGGLAIVGSPAVGAMSLKRTAVLHNAIGMNIGTGISLPAGPLVDVATCVFAGNQTGIAVTDQKARLTLTRNAITRNAVAGVDNAVGGLIESRGDNTIRGNGLDGGPFVPLPGF